MTAESIMKASPPGSGAGFWPNFDGYVLPGDQYNLYEEGHYNDTPVLIGTNSDEGALFVATTTAPAYEKSVHTGYGDYADKILAAYPDGSDAEASAFGPRPGPRFHLRRGAPGHGRGCSQRGARAKSTSIISAIGRRIPTRLSSRVGVQRTARKFPTSSATSRRAMPPSAEDRAVSDTVSSYWVNFAKTGDPKWRRVCPLGPHSATPSQK